MKLNTSLQFNRRTKTLHQSFSKTDMSRLIKGKLYINCFCFSSSIFEILANSFECEIIILALKLFRVTLTLHNPSDYSPLIGCWPLVPSDYSV